MARTKQHRLDAVLETQKAEASGLHRNWLLPCTAIWDANQPDGFDQAKVCIRAGIDAEGLF
jgi:hypothetical protein